mmetsp:Transcript_17908/g.28242  ORF Transcript_17908/g.28242 Transcript_17908/m.28242 type:complete len:91 (-) Transcript_17908:7-279(-)
MITLFQLDYPQQLGILKKIDSNLLVNILFCEYLSLDCENLIHIKIRNSFAPPPGCGHYQHFFVVALLKAISIFSFTRCPPDRRNNKKVIS